MNSVTEPGRLTAYGELSQAGVQTKSTGLFPEREGEFNSNP